MDLITDVYNFSSFGKIDQFTRQNLSFEIMKTYGPFLAEHFKRFLFLE